MYKFLGWTNVLILFLLVCPYILTFYNKILKKGSFKLIVIILFLKKLHKKLGILLIFMPLLHGYMALGEIPFHTGSILYLFILLTIIHGAIYSQFRKRIHYNIHKMLAIFSCLLFLIHLGFPWAFSFIFK